MNLISTYIARGSILGSFFLPAFALAQETGAEPMLLGLPVQEAVPLGMENAVAANATLEMLIQAGFYVSILGFVIATIILFLAIRKFGKSTLGTIFSFLFLGTATFLVIAFYQNLGPDYFGISDDSMDVWWHVMFYTAFLLYFLGLKMLAGLGSSEQDPSKKVMVGSEKMWGVVALAIYAAVFFLPAMLEPWVMQYNASALSGFGLHHFLAFALAGLVTTYLASVKSSLGLIGKAIATPMIIATAALALQHLWELFFESWKLVVVTSEVGEGIEKIFLTVAALCISWAGLRLYNFAKK